MTDNAIIFDLDGTLWDSSGSVWKIWNSVFEKTPGITLRLRHDDIGALMGTTMEGIGAMLFPQLSAAERNALMDACGRAETVYLREHGAVLYEGVPETLAALAAAHPLYIVSNCQEGYIEAFLHAHGLAAFFRDIECSGHTGKPKGDNIRLLMARNGISNAVYVGDTDGDRRAAAEAGIPFIHAGYGFSAVEECAHRIERIGELVEAADWFLPTV